ncbi:ABC transporter ATP-binding protein [bacterium]|nr:ABC transporter ATP-binding protein [bacterium]
MTASSPPLAAEPPEAIVEVHDLRKTYVMGDTAVHALDGISLAFRRGEYIAIVGASGSGKSTLLNILGCLDRPTSGSYRLNGQDVSKMSDDALSEIRSRYLGFIFQSYNLIPQLTVVENIEVPLFYQAGTSREEARERAIALARAVGLGHRLNHRPTELSGGQQQRVAIARALVNDPVVLLADEPTGNLDTATGSDILGILADLNRHGKTVITVTHDAEVAEAAGRTVRISDGKIVDGVMT